MAEGDAPATAAKGGLDFLKQKVGPLPLGVWILIGLGVLWYFEHQKAAASSASATPNQQTDPAGNVGSIDPATGYVYGTPEDQAALAANDSGSSSPGTGAASGGTSGAQTYADNNAWGIAAVNYLVGLGIDATTANQAVQQYLASQPLTTAQQGDINLVLASPIGPPPTLPGPVSTNPNPVTGGGTSGSGGTGQGTIAVPNVVGQPQEAAYAILSAAGLKASGSATVSGKVLTVDSQSPAAGAKAQKGSTVTLKSTVHGTGSGTGTGTGKGKGGTGRGVTAAVPTGLVVDQKHSTSLQVKWNKSANATGYHVKCTDRATSKVTNEFDVSSGQALANCGGLTPGHSYVVDVWAEPESGAVGTGAHAEVSATLPKTG